MPEHPHDLTSFRDALLEGDRRHRARRRTQVAGAIAAVLLALVVALPLLGGGVDAQAVAAQARRALDRAGILHTVTVVGDQRIERWSIGDRSHAVTYVGGKLTAAQSTANGRTRVRLAGRDDVTEIPAGTAPTPDDMLLRFRSQLGEASEVTEVDEDGVPALRLVLDGPIPQVAYLRRDDRLPIRIELEGGAVVRFAVIEWVPEDGALLDLGHTGDGRSSVGP
jgi:hypothetical protein